MSETTKKLVDRVDLEEGLYSFESLIEENYIDIDLSNENDYDRIVYIDPETMDYDTHPLGYDDEKDDMNDKEAAVLYMLEQMDAGKKVYFIDSNSIPHSIVPGPDGHPVHVSHEDILDPGECPKEPVMPTAPEKVSLLKVFLNKITFGKAFKAEVDQYKADKQQYEADMETYHKDLEEYPAKVAAYPEQKLLYDCLCSAEAGYANDQKVRKDSKEIRARQLITEKQLSEEGKEQTYEDKLRDIESMFYGKQPTQGMRPSQQQKSGSIDVYEPSKK